jgi:hypothetical protein
MIGLDKHFDRFAQPARRFHLALALRTPAERWCGESVPIGSPALA